MPYWKNPRTITLLVLIAALLPIAVGGQLERAKKASYLASCLAREDGLWQKYGAANGEAETCKVKFAETSEDRQMYLHAWKVCTFGGQKAYDSVFGDAGTPHAPVHAK